MKKFSGFFLVLISIGFSGSDTWRDGVMIGSGNSVLPELAGRVFTVVDSFTGPYDYSQGLAFDGRYIWNNYTWSTSIARIDPVTHTVVNTFTPTYGNRDMAFDGAYLWVSHWQTYSIYKYDTSNFALIASFDPPFSGHANGLAWDGSYLWVGEESGRIYKMTTTGDTIRSIPFNAAYPSDPRGLGFSSDGHLWAGHQGYGRVYEIDTTDGAIINWYPAPGYVSGLNFQQGVDFGGGYLWTTSGGTYNRIYKIDIGLTPVKEHERLTVTQIGLNVMPNPGSNTAKIALAVAQPISAALFIVDAAGRTAATVFENQQLAAGNYCYRLPRELNQGGVYFIVLRAGNAVRSVKLVLMK